MDAYPDRLEEIVITPVLLERNAGERNIAAEHEALTDLVGCAATDSAALLSRLVDLALRLCNAGSCGVSLLEPSSEPGMGVFRWVAMAGLYKGYVGGTTPESFSPCGHCLTRGSIQLYRHPARLFTYLAKATPAIVEGLVIPLRSELGPLGTIWIVSHDETRQFTSGDAAVMRSLADFTSTALALQRGRDAAESANRAKDEFLAIVSHELRRPLTAIVGWSELLLAGQSSAPTAARAIEALYTNARRQQHMIEDLLDASRASAGVLGLNERTMDLAEVVHSALEVVADAARAAGVVIIPEFSQSLPFHGDPERLHQVVANLLSNAVKFTPAGGSIFVNLDRSASSVGITIRDTGIGLAPHVLPTIFDAFCKADGSSTRRDSGLGLGLTIARRLVEMHGGRLEARSDGEGRGSSFTVRLPVSRTLVQPPAKAAAPALPSGGLALKGITVLVVDDEGDVRDILTKVLEAAGAGVLTAAGVEDALAVLKARSVDVLVTDLVMPGQDGYELLKRVRHETKKRVSAAIAVTALASARDRQRVLAAGFDHYVAKPIDFAALLRLVGSSSKVEQRH